MKHIIWSNDINIGDWESFLNEEYPDVDEFEKLDIVYEVNDEYLEDERVNLSSLVYGEIIVIGMLGLWNGTAHGYKIIKSGKVSDCLYDDCDIVTWYVDRYNNFRCDGIHHDGTNHYLYRAWRDGISDEQKENFLDKIYSGKATSKDITRYTKSIGVDIKKVYGWR